MSTQRKRGPLFNIIFATTGEDIQKCNGCEPCCYEVTEEMDLTLGELLHAAFRDEPGALTNDTLWNCDAVLHSEVQCQEGIDLIRVIQLLRQEAVIRGVQPSELV
jgi:heterodisulfide reductase subunit C